MLRSIFILLILVGCSHPGPAPIATRGTSFTILKQAILPGVETSIINDAGEVIAFTDMHQNGILSRTNFGFNFERKSTKKSVLLNMRFSYIFEYAGVYYNLFQDNGRILMSSSPNLEDWSFQLTPVLLPMSGTNYENLWNAAIDVDANGVWHLLVECAPQGTNQAGVGLCYATAVVTNNEIQFTNPVMVIPGGGNPWIKVMDDGGLLVIHGQIENGFWRVAASTFDGTTWKTSQTFYIGAVGVHVCDPHAVQMYDGTTLLAVSYDQSSITMLHSEQSLEEIYQSLK